jgi:hypothetical protein
MAMMTTFQRSARAMHRSVLLTSVAAGVACGSDRPSELTAREQNAIISGNLVSLGTATAMGDIHIIATRPPPRSQATAAGCSCGTMSSSQRATA